MDVSLVAEKGKGALPEDILTQFQNTVIFGDVLLPQTFSLRDKVELFKRKDQNTSLACGGEAFAYLTQLLNYLRDGKVTELSAKFIYANVKAPQGGSNASVILPFLTTVGVAAESLVPSYDNGNPPGEPFMSDKASIPPEAYKDALTRLFKNPASYISTDIDQVKKAIFLGNGSVIAVLGRNENWTAEGGEITIPKKTGSFWGHFICLIGWQFRNGKLYFEFVNSWGTAWGDNGYGYLPADYLLQGFGYGENTLVERPAVPPQSFNHPFNINMQYGDVNEEVVWLQLALQKLGYFPQDRVPSRYYLDITRAAVEKFQKANGVWNPLIVWYDQSKYVGPKTRSALNRLVN